jgi:3-oxoacyl-[acyl-carrier protein] reductase
LPNSFFLVYDYSEMKHAVITGGSGTLGYAIATVMQTPSWKISIPSRTELDVSDKSSVVSYFEQSNLDLLICAAGLAEDSPLIFTKNESWNRVMTVNFDGAAMCAQAVLPKMVERKCGHLIFISSYSAIHPPAGQIAYVTAKASLLGLTSELAQRYGRFNIRVNAILPGFIESRMTQSVQPKRHEEILRSHVLSRLNTPKEVSKFIRFLHFEMPHTSGQFFQLDSRPV